MNNDNPTCPLISKYSGPACDICAGSLTTEDLQCLATFDSILASNAARNAARQEYCDKHGISNMDLYELQRSDSELQEKLPPPAYGSLDNESRSKVIAKCWAAHRAHSERTAVTRLQEAIEDSSYSHLRQDHGSILVYRHDSTSPSGVMLGVSVPLTDEVRKYLADRRASVNLGPSRGQMAEAQGWDVRRF